MKIELDYETNDVFYFINKKVIYRYRVDSISISQNGIFYRFNNENSTSSDNMYKTLDDAMKVLKEMYLEEFTKLDIRDAIRSVNR